MLCVLRVLSTSLSRTTSGQKDGQTSKPVLLGLVSYVPRMHQSGSSQNCHPNEGRLVFQSLLCLAIRVILRLFSVCGWLKPCTPLSHSPSSKHTTLPACDHCACLYRITKTAMSSSTRVELDVDNLGIKEKNHEWFPVTKLSIDDRVQTI